MRAVILDRFGGPGELRLGTVADPEPGRGQVRIAVHAAGVNPVDAGNRADGSWAGLRLPCILGYDIAGVVERLGPGVTGLRPGDRVMAMTHFRDGAGGYAELAVVDASLVAPIGANTSFAEAAATPLAGGTAAEVLDRLALPAGARLLVLGGSGGVGLFLLQLAARRNLRAIGVGRRAMHEQMLALGAAACVDYTGGTSRDARSRRPEARSTRSPTWSAARCWPNRSARCARAARPRRSPPRSSTWAPCWTTTSRSTGYSSRTTADGPGTWPRCWTSGRCGR
jgi:NADPH:quinone reductase-like Zn-dependent oxidoreductase